MSSFRKIAVLGAGAWGTALANAAARAGREVVLWEFDEKQANALIKERVNTLYLPGVKLADEVTPAADIHAIAGCDAALMVVPAQHMRATAALAAPHLKKDVPVISCAKGIERGSLSFMSQILRATLPHNPACALSGPSFAADVAHGLPAAVTLAAKDEWLAADLSRALASPVLRLYHSDDVIGVEIGGAAKNVIAIGAGIAAGVGLGQSAGAAFIARGFAELRRFGSALGGKPETLMGLSGLGDLVLTATSPQSRNFSYGVAIGKGASPDGKLAEGAFTAQALVELAQKNHVEMPIATAVRDVLDGKITVSQAIETLLARPLTSEE
ncbi:glycerol-3-phosphate dehydrogenase [NAD(P)+] [Terrihabitans soli]|uniref:Glycerol-3-phosphate dehydrogenase [NAD(P)+] n=1 Tax=Terrihabitans soli TaxID=708113 RepID=A0A6S6QR45_9HYPH|nr:NAD(P)H-dependent glycerol-3-phosphate dehydrogenase [Terrihabitans soli]BCJ89511.1 glycerol-3-phosphate dehydrogenase [NAD(P)+] [Terrihabitans soli]